jgi:hypothetical protein
MLPMILHGAVSCTPSGCLHNTGSLAAKAAGFYLNCPRSKEREADLAYDMMQCNVVLKNHCPADSNSGVVPMHYHAVHCLRLQSPSVWINYGITVR